MSRSTPERRLTGWVRNEPDGSVRLELQGAPGDVEAGLSAVREAMAGRITRVERNEVGEVAGEDGFVIAR